MEKRCGTYLADHKLQRDAVRIEISAERAEQIAIKQRVHFADDRAHEYRLLDHVLGNVGGGQSIIFIATKRDAEALANKLQDEGHTAAALHGDMNQRDRDRTLTRMHRGGVRTLVATDVAARGLDVPGVTHVINFDLHRSRPRTTCTGSGAPDARGLQASPCRSRIRWSAARCARSSATRAPAFRRT